MWTADFYGWSKKFGREEFLCSIPAETREKTIGWILRIVNDQLDWKVSLVIDENFPKVKQFTRVVFKNDDGFSDSKTREELEGMRTFL